MAKTPKEFEPIDILSDIDDQITRYITGMQQSEDALAASRIQYEMDLAKKREENLDRQKNQRKNIIDDLVEYEAAGLIQNDVQRAALSKQLLSEQMASKLKSEIEVLQMISKESQKEREKELKVLDAKKKVAQAQAKSATATTKEGKKEAKKEEKKAKKELNKETGNTLGGGIKEGFKDSFKDLRDELKEGNSVSKAAAENTQKAMKAVGKAITDGLNAVNNSITAYSKHQTAVNARLNGVSSYSKIADSLNSIAFSPLLNAEDLYNNVSELVGQGIVTNIEQRALFASVKDGIATTFDVTSDSLNRIIRLQQNDSTAARFGMEAYLNEFLNVYVENTEYLQSTFDSVASSLLEASAMLKYNTGNTGASLEFEYQVQKWLGALTGVGLSDEAANNIASAIGQLGTGDVESLSNSDINNLLLMGANKAGNVSYADLLTDGIDANDVNDLMYGMISYMQEIADSGSNIIKNQLAKTFGISVSDILATRNFSAGELAEIKGDTLTYDGMYSALKENFDALPGRLGIANILDNLFANMNYQTGANIAKNPALFALWKVTDLIQNTTGGINIPAITAMGSGFDLEATVENLMKLGIMGVSTLGNIGSIISGVASAANGSSLLSATKVSASGAVIKEVGGGTGKRKNGKRQSGDSLSSAGYVGNSDGDSYKDSAVNDSSDESEKKKNEKQKEEADKDPVVKYLRDEVRFTDRFEQIFNAVIEVSTNVQALTGVNAGIYSKNDEIAFVISNLRDITHKLGVNAVKYFNNMDTSTFSSYNNGESKDYKSKNTPVNSNSGSGSADSDISIIIGSKTDPLTVEQITQQLAPIIEKLTGINDLIKADTDSFVEKADIINKSIEDVKSSTIELKSINDKILESVNVIVKADKEGSDDLSPTSNISYSTELTELNLNLSDIDSKFNDVASSINQIVSASNTLVSTVGNIDTKIINKDLSFEASDNNDLIDYSSYLADILNLLHIITDNSILEIPGDVSDANISKADDKLSETISSLSRTLSVMQVEVQTLMGDRSNPTNIVNKIINTVPDVQVENNIPIEIPEIESPDVSIPDINIPDINVVESLATISNESNNLDIIKYLDSYQETMNPNIESSNMGNEYYSYLLSLMEGFKNKAIESVSASSDLLNSSIYTVVTMTQQEIAIPKGEQSPVGDSSDANSNQINETVLADKSNDLTLGYLGTEDFAVNFKSIVENVAKIAGDSETKEWINPTSSRTNSYASETANTYSTPGRIDGLTQYSSSRSNSLEF